MQAEESEPAHDEAIGFVDHPQPGQGDFDDESSATLPGKKCEEQSKGDHKLWLHIQLHYTDTNTCVYLTLGAHAPQGYSSWVCLCMCVCMVQFFQTVTNWPRRPADCLSATIT